MASSIKCKGIMFNSVVDCIWDTTCMHWKWMRLTKNCFLWSASNIYKWNSNWYFPVEYATKLIYSINWKVSKKKKGIFAMIYYLTFYLWLKSLNIYRMNLNYFSFTFIYTSICIPKFLKYIILKMNTFLNNY